MSLSSFAVNAPVKVTMIFVGILLLGYISLTRLPTNLFPDIRTPRVTTTFKTRGLSALEVEKRICEQMERALFTVRGVVDVKTIARADSAVITAEFTWDTPLDFAFLDVKKAVADIQRERGSEIESASTLRYDPNAVPVVTIAVRGREGGDLEDLRKLAENTLKPRFERLEGVANVVVAGGIERELLIELDEKLLLQYGLDVSQVSTALRQDNVNATGGYVEEGARRYLLKAVGEFRDQDQIERVVVGRQGEAPILLRDVATIAMVPREAISLAFMDERDAVSLSFYREAESNTVSVAKAIRKEMEDVKATLPKGTELFLANDQSTFITAAINEVRDNAVLGGLLAILILVVFLRDFRTTAVIAISIPISIVATFNLMYFQGLSLNLMSLGGLALGTGMLVDNAIVVLENIFRLRQRGVESYRAAREGSKEVAGAILASTLTTIVVFLPIVYIEGVAALLFREQSLTVTYSLLASLVVALLLIPMLSARFLGKPPDAMTSEERDEVPTNLYARMLGGVLRFRGLTMLTCAAVLAATWLGYQRIPREFLPRTESRQVTLRLVAPSGTPIEAMAGTVRTVMAAADAYRPAVQNVFARVGEYEGGVNADTEDPDGPNTAELFILLDDPETPTTATLAAGLKGFKSSDLVEKLKPTLDRLEGVKADFKLEQGSILEILGGAGAPLVLEISGAEIDQLTLLAGEAQAALVGVPGISNVRTNILEGSPEVRIALDRVQLGRLGLDVNGVAETLRKRIEGEVATQIKREQGDVDLRVKVDYGRESLSTLRNIVLRAADGSQVPLSNIATFEVVRGPREIVRRRQERIARVSADLDGIKLSEAIARATPAVDRIEVPRGYHITYTGEEESRREAFGKLTFALILSIALVYMVMASIFESFAQPFLILFTIPLAGTGVVACFLATGQTLNVMAFIGIVMLGGIVVNNAIVLLDCVNQVRAANPGLSTRDTLLIGCSRRLRPVFMTTATTLLGLLPLALGLGEGAELRQAMAVAVIGGLFSSTALTLFVLPACQSYLDSLLALLRRGLSKLSARSRKDSPAAG